MSILFLQKNEDMEKKIYSRRVAIRDKNKDRWEIEFRVYEETPFVGKNIDTLEEFEENLKVSICGEGGTFCGQCYDDIVPRTEGQKELLNFWEKYHRSSIECMTRIQQKYLEGEQYKNDFDAFVKLFQEYDRTLRSHFDSTTFNIICKAYQVQPENMDILRGVINERMSNNPIYYILGFDLERLKHTSDDFCVKCFFLAIRGLYIDRGYRYGSEWLYLPIPKDICLRIENLCRKLEIEDEELSQELAVPDDFDMGTDNFKATESIVEKVMEMRNCVEYEAKRFIALGIYLQSTFSDLDDTFQEVEDCLYKANGIEYYIGTEEELEKIARNRLYDDGEYDHLWREAVAAKETTDSLQDWLKSLLEDNGWCSILNSWDGTYHEYNIDKEQICVSRT